MKQLNKRFGEIVASRRRDSQLSQEDLANEAKLHRTYISQIERGIKSPTIGVLFDICSALKVAPSVIVKQLEGAAHA